MGEGSMFVWIAWMIWIILVFLCRPTPKQSYFSIWILIIISTMHVTISWLDFNISLSFVLLFLGSLVAHVRFGQKLYHLFCALTVSLAFATIKIWSVTMPVWLFLPRTIMFPAAILVLLMIVTKTTQSRLMIALLGLSNGELMYKLIMTDYNIPVEIGTFAFFDQLIMTVIFVWTLHLLQQLIQHTFAKRSA